jgi:Protein of unknown function (DUF1549)/Protein of unknown function (DUF1553)
MRWIVSVAFATLGLLAAFVVPDQVLTGADRAVARAAKGTGSKVADPASPEGKPTDDDVVVESSSLPSKVYSTGYDGSYTELLGFINGQIRQGWQDNNVTPSPPADDSEWIRRIHLDIVGHIPDLDTVKKFVADKDPAKRAKQIDRLLEDPAFARYQTTIWTNNLIGRATPRDIDRAALQKFLRESFGKNRGWNEIVVALLTAEGPNDKVGATNFLLSHLNDEAVPATAISAKLFLGVQVQCTQCHNHPFNDWKQNTFWEFNSFFKQARSREVRKYNEKTGRMDVDHLELTAREFGGPVYYERRNGVMEVAYPKYNNVEVSPEGSVNRRQELAKLITSGDRTLIADAMVNRMWGHFLGFGFTKPVDDMGPHNAPSHPVLLERLSTEFVKAGYDLRQLIRWIANSEAYNLTSRFNAGNSNDNPGAGEMPLFSHLYLKSMSAEQLYDSLIVATNAHKSGTGNWEQAESKRQQWMQQFVQAFGTDENDESSSFDGTIPQALMMMNGELMQSALAGAKGSVLYQVVNEKGNPPDKIRLLYLATLSRAPSTHEVQAANRILKSARSAGEAYQDLYWALLNSNEFIMNH